MLRIQKYKINHTIAGIHSTKQVLYINNSQCENSDLQRCFCIYTITIICNDILHSRMNNFSNCTLNYWILVYIHMVTFNMKETNCSLIRMKDILVYLFSNLIKTAPYLTISIRLLEENIKHFSFITNKVIIIFYI